MSERHRERNGARKRERKRERKVRERGTERKQRIGGGVVGRAVRCCQDDEWEASLGHEGSDGSR